MKHPSKKHVKAHYDYCFARFEKRAKARLCQEYGWKTSFSKQTGVNVARLHYYRQKGRVPKNIMQLIPVLKRVEPRKNRRLSDDERERLNELIAADDTPAEMSRILTCEFGERFTPIICKTLRYHSRKKQK